MTRNEQFGILITNSFQTLTGGILYYDYKNIFKFNEINKIYLIIAKIYSQININQLFLIEQLFG
jgi:hypothetical protein